MNEYEEGWFLPEGEPGQRMAQAYGDFLLLLRGLRASLPEKAVLAHRKPRLVSYLTGRPCVPMPDLMQAAPLGEALRRQGVTHIVREGLFLSTRRILNATGRELGLRLVVSVRSAGCAALPVAAEPPK